MPAVRVSAGLRVEHRRPKAGDAPHEGLLKVERRVFRCLGVWDESGLGRKWFWDESGFGMKVVLDENFWDEK